MKRIYKGSTLIVGAVAAVVIGALLLFGIVTANKQNSGVNTNKDTVTEAVPSTTTTQVAPTMKPSTATSGVLDQNLQDIDTKIGSLDTDQKNIDAAINDKPLDTGL